MSVDPSSLDAASTSQVRLKDAYLGVLMEKQWGNPSDDSDNPEAEIWYCKGNQVTGEPVAQNSNAWEQPLARGASSSLDQERQNSTDVTKDPLPPHIARHIAAQC